MQDAEHESRALGAVRKAVKTVPFYVKQGLTVGEGPLADVLAKLPLLTRDNIRPTLPKVWLPEGRDLRAELASGSIAVEEAGPAGSRVRILFDPRWWKEQEKRALAIHPRGASTLASEIGTFRDAVLWTPERGTGSCGAGDPTYEERIAGTRLHLNSRQDPTFWTDAVMTRMLDELAIHETTALYADPFYLDVLARHAAILNRRLDVRGFVATMGSRATNSHREALARVYQGTVVDVYASREVGTLFVQGDDDKMHHAPFATHVELLPAKVETPGACDVALVVVTTVERTAQPLVRYVLGDLVQVERSSPSRYTNVPPISSVEGTIDDSILRPDGAIVTPGAIDRAIGTMARAYQVTQSDEGSVEVEVIGGAADSVTGALAPLLAGMKLNARTTSAIAIESNGKYRTSRRARVPFELKRAFHETDTPFAGARG